MPRRKQTYDEECEENFIQQSGKWQKRHALQTNPVTSDTTDDYLVPNCSAVSAVHDHVDVDRFVAPHIPQHVPVSSQNVQYTPGR